MAVSVTCQKITKQANGEWCAQFADGTTYNFATLAEMQGFGAEIDGNNSEGAYHAQAILIRWWLARTPEGTNLNLAANKVCEIDLASPNPVKVS